MKCVLRERRPANARGRCFRAVGSRPCRPRCNEKRGLSRMPEGLSAAEASKEVQEHAKHSAGQAEHERRDRAITIGEAVLLSLVTLAAAWSGYAAAKWSTESS